MRLRLVARQDAALVVVSLLLIAYAAVRCARVGLTHDEAVTDALFVTRSFGTILASIAPGLPDNNHLLLSLLAKCSVLLFGNTEFALRLPSLAAYAVYLAAVAATLRLFLSGAALWIYFLFLAVNPYIVDMMTIARGYGLGLGLSAASLYFLLSGLLESRDWVRLALAETLMAFAIMAHLTYLLPFLALVGFHLLLLAAPVMRGETNAATMLRAAWPPALVSACLIGVMLPPIMRIHEEGLFALPNFGVTSFFTDAVEGAVDGSLYGAVNPGIVRILGLLSCAVIALAVGIAAAAVPKRLSGSALCLLAVTFLIVASALGNILQHHLLGASYLYGRMTTLFIPLFGIACAVLLANRALAGAGGRFLATGLTLLPLVYFPAFIAAANFERTRDWVYDVDSKAVVGLLEDLHRTGRAPASAQLDMTWYLEASVDYYADRTAFDWLVPSRWTRPNRPLPASADFYYLAERDFIPAQAAIGRLEIIQRYPRSATVLARPVARDP